ncbi:hypothetical protein [Foetidibacter luteolus]|uniref:hypothetical protein n=1 Tax=Foetidibacter luteolus TaxID=2608880 RepID=UPI00129BE31D|nr:hypothetical protein [Foetidibacter luteolus]
MKILYLFPLLFLISCENYLPHYAVATAKNSLSDIPVKPHTRPVDIFFNNEGPKEPYYRIKMVEVTGRLSATLDEMILALKEKAKAEGIDAVLVDNPGKQANSQVSVPFGEGIMSYQKLVGIGLRYKHTIDYMDQLVKRQSVTVWDENETALKNFDIDFDMSGNCITNNEAVRQYFNYNLYPYDAGDIHYVPQNGWGYNLDTFLHQLISKRMVITLDYALTCNYTYDDRGTLREIKIKKPDTDYSVPAKQVMKIFYNADGSIERKELFEKKERKWIEQPVYFMSGKLMKVERFTFINGKKKMLAKSDFTYYSNDDLPAPLQP